MEGAGGVEGGWVLIGVKEQHEEEQEEDDLCVCHCKSPSHFNLCVIRCHDHCCTDGEEGED